MIDCLKGIFGIIQIWINGFKEIPFFDLGFSLWQFIVGLFLVFVSISLLYYIFDFHGE